MKLAKMQPFHGGTIMGRCLCILLSVAALAGDSLNAAAYDDYVQLRVNDTASQSSFAGNDSGHWQKKNEQGEFVVEANGPYAGEKYYVPAEKTLIMSAPNASAGNPVAYTFGGDELVLAGRLWVATRRSSLAADDAVMRIDNLVLPPGGYLYSANGRPAALAGTCTVMGTSKDPSCWYDNLDTSTRPLIHAALKGDGTSVFWFRNPEGSSEFVYDGDASAFFGTMRVDSGLSTLTAGTSGGLDFPGTVALKNGATFSVPAGRVVRIGNLKSIDGSSLLLDPDGSAAPLVVTNGVSASGGAISVGLPFSEAAETIPLVTLAPDAAGTLSADDFANWTATATGLAGYPNALNLTLAMTNGADGSRTLAVSHRKIVYQDVRDSKEETSCFLPENASHWSDDGEISSENDYYVGIGGSAYAPFTAVDFGGASLTLCGPNMLNIRTSCHLTVADFRWVANGADGAQILVWGDGPKVSGKVTVVEVPGGMFRVATYNGQTFTIASELEGGGTLGLTSLTSAKNCIGNYELTGLSTNFAGRIHAFHGPYTNAQNKEKHESAPDTYCVTLTVSDSRNLGGPLKAFAADGILLANHSLLKTTGSLTFSEPTRGWTILGVGRAEAAEGETLTITNTQITYAGEFRKEGGGTLRLGGTARFTEDALETPLAGTNVLAIAEGALMPADVTGCDGLAVTFAAGAKLLLDASATGDLKTYGLYDVKWDAPITVADGAALPVAFALPEDFDAKKCHSFGICTVSATAAETMDEDDFAVKAPSGMKADVSKVENRNANDTVVSVSFVCDLVPCGLTIRIR